VVTAVVTAVTSTQVIQTDVLLVGPASDPGVEDDRLYNLG